MTLIAARMRDELVAALDERAAMEGRSRSWVIVRAVEEHLARNVKTALPVVSNSFMEPEVSMESLREIAAGKIPEEMCGIEAYNEIDGEWYRCRLPKHPKKVRCQPGEKVEK